MVSLLLAAVDCFLYLRHPRQVLRFRRKVGYWPRIAWPRRYHEKMLWRRLIDRNPLFRVFCDKLAAKAFVAEHCPDIAVPETLWVGDDPAMIPDAILAAGAAIKTSHGCDQNVFIRSAPVDREALSRRIRPWLARPHGRRDHEWAYLELPRRLLAEELLQGKTPLIDISVRCAGGRAILASAIIGNKTPEKRIGYFTPDGEREHVDADDDDAAERAALPADFVMPDCLGEAVRAAETLSRVVDYLRCDFMVVDGRLHAGELTVYPAAGIDRSHHDRPGSVDARLATAWDLRRSWFLTTPQRGWRAIYAQALRERLAAAEGGG